MTAEPREKFVKQKGMKTNPPKPGQLRSAAYKEFMLQYNWTLVKCKYWIDKCDPTINLGTVEGVIKATRLFDKIKAERF